MTKKIHYLILLLSVVLIGIFHNCANDNILFNQNSSKAVVSSIGTEYNGTGGTYLGKPLEGTYSRTAPNFECSLGQGFQGKLVVDTQANIQSDNCESTDYKFEFNHPVIYFNSYNRDYLGVGAAIYQYEDTGGQSLPLTEVWCSTNPDQQPLDIVIRTDNNLTAHLAKIYQIKNSLPRASNYFSIDRTSSSKTLNFSSNQLKLSISLPNNPSQLAAGSFEAIVDNNPYRGEILCRIANPAPISEMGSALTSAPLNKTTTDLQEITCNHLNVLACENLEDRTSATDLGRSKFANGGWQWEPGSYNITNISYDGSKALETINLPNGTGTGSIGLPFSNSQEIFFRYYAKWSANFVFSPTSTGVFAIDGTAGSLKIFANLDANQNLYLRTKTGDIQSSFHLETNQWYCMEGHIRSASSVAAGNGIAELWVNNSKVISSPLNIMDSMYVFSFYGNWYCADANTDGLCDKPSDQHPLQSVYYDNILIAKQRIGCF